MTLVERIERGLGDAEDARLVQRLIEALAQRAAAALAEALRADR